MTSVFLQVRLDSTRLPRKALADLGGRPLVVRCFEALDRVRADLRVLVTEPASAGDLGPLAREAGWEVYVGSKDNVLERFVTAARATGTDIVIRATGDNPLVSAALANQLLDRHLVTGADYSGFVGAPLGSGVEILRTSALETALSSNPDDYEREHVSPFLYRRPGQFRIDRPPVPGQYAANEARVTVDTPDDLVYIRSLWSDNHRGHPLEVEELIPWLTRHPR